MGNKTAKYFGMEKAPYTQEYSAERIIALVSTEYDSRYLHIMVTPSNAVYQIDNATRETTSGKFLNAITGAEVPW